MGPALGQGDPQTETRFGTQGQSADRISRSGDRESGQNFRGDSNQDDVAVPGRRVGAGRTTQDEAQDDVVAHTFIQDRDQVGGNRDGSRLGQEGDEQSEDGSNHDFTTVRFPENIRSRITATKQKA